MNIQSFMIEGTLPSKRDLNGNWWTTYPIKEKAMGEVILSATVCQVKPIQGKGKIEIHCYEPNLKRDPSNVRQGAEDIILDALQRAKIIRSDNWKGLLDTPPTVELDRDYPRIEVIITEIEEIEQ